MVSTQAFSNLLALLHSTPLEPSHWEVFLREVCALTESRHGFFLCSSSNLGLHVLGHGGSHDMKAAEREYNASSGALDPFRIPMLLNPRIGVLDGDEVLPAEEFLETALYKRLLQPVGLRYLTAMSLCISPRRMEAVSFWRGLDQGPMPPDKRELLEMLMPHMQVALEVRHRLITSERRGDNLQAMLDRTDSAAFLLSEHGRVLHSNEPATALLARLNLLEVRKGRLCARERLPDRELQSLLSAAGEGHSAGRETGGAMLLPRERGAGRPLQIVVSPVQSARGSSKAASVVVLVTDPETEICFPDVVLKGLYGLTHAETEVANAYLTGYTSEEIALLRGVSLSTVRSQLKVLLQKTGTNRQSDLLRLLMTVPRRASGAGHKQG
jgi:DNA-binding CsgD family transcriptional regulator